MTLFNEPSSLKSWHASWGAVDLRNSFWRFRFQVQLKHWWLIADLLLVDLDAVFLCVQNDLLLDGLTDLFETLGVYRLFHFRPKPRNPFFENRKFQLLKPEVENMLDKKRIQFCSVSPILLFSYFEQGRHQRRLKIFAPYVIVYGHTRTKMILAATRFEKSKNEDGALITETDELSDEIFFDFRFGYFQLPVSEKQPTSGF